MIDLIFSENPSNFVNILRKTAKPESHYSDVFCFKYFNKDISEIEWEKGWKFYQFEREFKRQGLKTDLGEPFRVLHN